jgi:hypothetical protein
MVVQTREESSVDKEWRFAAGRLDAGHSVARVLQRWREWWSARRGAGADENLERDGCVEVVVEDAASIFNA